MNMATSVRMAFDPAGTMLPVDRVLPVRVIRPETRKSPQYQRLLASIRELGIIEPLMVHPAPGPTGDQQRYSLLDGHTRLDIAKELGHTQVFCLVAKEDEAFTYNHKVNKIAPIQEHFMIMKALQSGVPEERIATTLNVDVGAIRLKRDLLNGICPEAVTLLKDRRITVAAIRELRRVSPMRQIEMAELMVAANNFSTGYAKCLIAGTADKDLVGTDKTKMLPGMKPEDAARMEREMEVLGREFRLVEESYGQNTLHLVLGVAYLRKMLENAGVVRYLSQHHADVLGEFQKLVESPDLKSAT
jgi:hypothetical protein